MWEVSKVETLWLKIANELRLPVLRVGKRVKMAYSAYKKYLWTPIHVLVDDFSSRMFVMELDLPASKRPVRFVLYLSAQDWYLTPSKALPKARKVLKYLKRYSQTSADTYVAVVAKRFTSGALKQCVKNYKVPVRTPKQVRSDWAKFFTEENLK